MDGITPTVEACADFVPCLVAVVIDAPLLTLDAPKQFHDGSAIMQSDADLAFQATRFNTDGSNKKW